MKTVVLVSGKLQSGKNTFADICIDILKNKYSVSYDYFARLLKERCKEDFKPLVDYVNSLNLEELHTIDDNWFENKNKLTRILLQIYGTEVFRNRVDQNYWANELVKNIKNSKSDIIFVTDVRFPSEITALENEIMNVVKVRINRTLDRTDVVNEHESEKALDDYSNWNYVYQNDGTLEQYQTFCEQVCEHLVALQNETSENKKFQNETRLYEQIDMFQE